MSRPAADLLRVLAIVAVMIIHATGAGERGFLARHEFAYNDFLAVLLNQLARFSVPIFVMLSGYGLARKYASVDGMPFSFFRERAWKIALPYLFWSLAIFIALGRGPGEILAGLLRGTADYHFYFFVIILQCYVLFPLLFAAAQTGLRRPLGVVLLLAHLLLTQPAQYLFFQLGLPTPHWHNSLFVFWIFYFYAGMLWARRETTSSSVRKPGPVLRALIGAAALVAFAAMTCEYVYRSYVNPVPDYYNHFNRHTVLVYALCVWALFYVFDGRIRAWLERYPRLARAITLGAGLSFFVYIFHTWILRGLEQTFLGQEVVLLTVSLTAIAFGLARLMHGVLPEGGIVWGTARTILGLPPKR